jgi:DNA-binding CsgD family transcriptional regulator
MSRRMFEQADLIHQIYDCALQPDQWSSTIAEIGKPIHAANGVMLMMSLSKNTATFQRQWNVAENDMFTYATNFHQDNILPTHFYPYDIDVPYGIKIANFEEKYLETRLCKEFSMPRGWLDSLGVTLMKSADYHATLSFARKAEAGWGTEDEVAFLGELSPHIRRALSISELLEHKAFVSNVFEETFNLLKAPIGIVNGSGAVLFANKALQDMADEGKYLTMQNRSLLLLDQSGMNQLSQALTRVTLPVERTEAPIHSFILRGRNGEPCSAHVLPMQAMKLPMHFGSSSAAVVVLVRRSPKQDTPSSVLSAAFGFTASELKVLDLMLNGNDTGDIRERLSVSMPTVRSHISSMLSKSGTERQQDLISLARDFQSPLVK